MFNLPEHHHNLSLRLSEVLDDIGVNERMVKMYRKSALLNETQISLNQDNSTYLFGSLSEGTTTISLFSDSGELSSHFAFNVIQDYAEWKPGPINLLMIQDDITSPGYCLLQLIRPDIPLPVTCIIHRDCVQDAGGRILLKNTIFDDIGVKGFKNGPARTLEEEPGLNSLDYVNAISCESWPTEARVWSERSLGKWPTEVMKRYAENSGCFVVPVGSKISLIEDLEWRMSTSKAERCLMFNLNITQIWCFVLLKMILKTYLNHPVSSYMCKTVFLRCTEKTHNNLWQENDSLKCLTVCLQALYTSILHKSCPHFFIPGNNLMARQFSPRMKDKLLKILHHILEGKGAALYGIHIDDLGERLAVKMNPFYQSVQYIPSVDDCFHKISGIITTSVANVISISTISDVAKERSPKTVSGLLLQDILLFLRLYKNGTNVERVALHLTLPLFCSNLGSVIASVNIGTNHSVSPEALNWLSVGLNSDVSSGRLKLASVLYCASDMLRVESILKETERMYDLDFVEPVCGCYECPRLYMKKSTAEFVIA